MSRWTFPDPRSLALLRMAVGLALLLDLLPRLPLAEAHYGDLGAFPRADSVRAAPAAALIFHNASGWWGAAILLFLLHATAATALLAGYRPRAAALLCWLLSTSLAFRNPAVAMPGDEWLRMLLFWGIFLPWAERWTVRPGPARLESAFLWAFLAQLGLGLALAGAAPPPLAFLGLLALLPSGVWLVPPGAWIAGRLDRLGAPSPQPPARFARGRMVALATLLTALVWVGGGAAAGWPAPAPIAQAVKVLGLDLQPTAALSEWTLVAEGKRGGNSALSDDTVVTLTVSPASARWPYYFSHVASTRNSGLAVLYGRYLAYLWNAGEPSERVGKVIVSRVDLQGKRKSQLAIYAILPASPQKPTPASENSLSRK